MAEEGTGKRGVVYELGLAIAQGVSNKLRGVKKDSQDVAKSLNEVGNEADTAAQKLAAFDAAMRASTMSRYAQPGQESASKEREAPKSAEKLFAESVVEKERAAVNQKKHNEALLNNTKYARVNQEATKNLIMTYAKKALKILAVVKAFKMLIGFMKSAFEAGRKIAAQSRQLAVFFGNQTNAINAMAFARKKLLAGEGAFGGEDFAKGAAALGRIGVDAKKNYKLIADMAGTTGKSFAETSDAITSAIHGNEGALESFGLMGYDLRQMTGSLKSNTPELRKAILSFLKNQKMFAGGAAKSAKTWEGIMKRIRGFWTEFKLAIVGDTADTNSLYSKVLATFDKIAKFLAKHGDKIKKIGVGIGMVFKWVWRQIEIAFTKIGRFIGKMLNSSNGFFENFQQRMMSIILWLEIAKIKIIAFVRKWATELKVVAGILASLWAVGKLNKFIAGIRTLNGVLGMRGGTGLVGRLLLVAGAIDLIQLGFSKLLGIKDAKSMFDPEYWKEAYQGQFYEDKRGGKAQGRTVAGRMMAAAGLAPDETGMSEAKSKSLDVDLSRASRVKAKGLELQEMMKNLTGDYGMSNKVLDKLDELLGEGFSAERAKALPSIEINIAGLGKDKRALAEEVRDVLSDFLRKEYTTAGVDYKDEAPILSGM